MQVECEAGKWMDLFLGILTSVGENSDLPAILIGIVVAYLTIFISVAIAIFSKKKDFEALDRNVILDHVIKAKYLLLSLSITFLPLLFWNISLPCIRLLELICWIVGVAFILKSLISSYYWMKGKQFRLRFSYLDKLHNREDMEEVWQSVWQAENINIQNEQEFFNIFHSTVTRSLESGKKCNLAIASKLLSDFNNFLDKRSTEFLTLSDGTLDNTLQWHFEVWGKEYEYLGRNTELTTWTIYNELSRTLDSILRKIEIRALKNSVSFSFFKKLENHAEKYKKESVSSHYYVESLFDTFYQVFFQNIYLATERYDIWNHYFPSQWKVTKSYLENSENIISGISLKKFLEWANGRIWQASGEKDFSLNDISTNLFPEADPVLWAKILIFVFSPYGEDRLRSVVEKPWNFGFMGRVKVYNTSQDDEIRKMDEDEEELNTFDLSYILFKKEFSKINLMSYLKSLEQLLYPENSVEESKRLQLHRLFTKMLSSIQQDQSQSQSQS